MIITVDKDFSRLDAVLPTLSDMSRAYAQRLIKEGKVLLNGQVAECKKSVKAGDVIQIEDVTPKTLDLTPVNIPLDIVYQDDFFAVINKQQGLSVHAGNGYDNTPTLVNALLYRLDKLSSINGVIRPGIVHRIDKNTSGLLVVAKCDFAHKSLAEQIEKKSARRSYIALLEGVLKQDEGDIKTNIARSVKDRTKMAVSSDGKYAETHFKVIKRYAEYTLCRFDLKTGRTHQIRVHAKYMGHPVVGDKEYGYKKQKFALDGQLLHAFELELTHPQSGERMTFNAPLPDYFERVLKSIASTEIKE